MVVAVDKDVMVEEVDMTDDRSCFNGVVGPKVSLDGTDLGKGYPCTGKEGIGLP